MTKFLKRPLSVLLAVLMIAGIFTALPLTAYAAPTETLLTTITGAGSNAGTATSANVSYSTEGVATLTFSGVVSYQSSPAWGWWGYGWTATVTPADGYTITKCVFYDDANRTATDSEAPFVVETTEEDKTPQVNGTPMAYTSKGIKKIEVYGYATPTHTHDFTYAADGATITATCNGAGTCDITSGTTLTISAPTGDLTADGTTTFSATLNDDYNTTAFPGTYTIVYTKDGQPYDGTPTEAGDYTASVTVGTATASCAVTVTDPLADAKTSAKADLDTLLTEKNQNDYDAADWTTLTQAITDGKTAIDNATTIDDVATAKSNAETAANAVKTTAEKLADAKTAAKADLDTLLAGKTEADYDADDWTTLTQAIADGKTAIDNATTIDDVATAKSNAEASANAVKTTAEKKEEADTKAANDVTNTINALPDADKVTTADKDAIEAARKAYDDLTDDQKAKVDAETLKKLTDAETALAKEEADTKAANDVTNTINALPDADKVTTADKDAIEAARKTYDDLTDDQKAKVDAETLKKLTDAETALAAAEKQAADEEQAAKELAAAKTNAQKAMNNQVTVTQKGKKITVKWSKSTAADGYQVFAQYCGKKTTKPVKTIKKNTTTKVNITKINGKKINLKKQFKVFVKAYKVVNGKKVTLAKSIVGHVVGVKNAKYTNVKSIKVTKSKLTVKVGKTAKVKAKVTLVDKNKKHIPKSHAAKFRYRTSNKKIATVTKSGKIKGIKKGTCTIYVYAINGKMKKVKVTVK